MECITSGGEQQPLDTPEAGMQMRSSWSCCSYSNFISPPSPSHDIEVNLHLAKVRTSAYSRSMQLDGAVSHKCEKQKTEAASPPHHFCSFSESPQLTLKHELHPYEPEVHLPASLYHQ